MKGLGNYRTVAAPTETTERRVAQVALFHGPRASITFADGSTQTVPAEPLRKLGLVEGQRFFTLITWQGRKVVNVKFTLAADARPALPGRPMAKVMLRDGLKMTTRR